MTYETMDWEAEAKRVARAFGLSGHYEFVNEGDRRGFRPLNRISDEPCFVNAGEFVVCVTYYNEGPDFRVAVYGFESETDLDTWIGLGWDNSIEVIGVATSTVSTLSRALFHLDFLSPEVEAALNISISAHQKMEWKLEYEQRWSED